MNEKKQPKPVLARTPDHHKKQKNDDDTNKTPQAKNLAENFSQHESAFNDGYDIFGLFYDALLEDGELGLLKNKMWLQIFPSGHKCCGKKRGIGIFQL